MWEISHTRLMSWFEAGWPGCKFPETFQNNVDIVWYRNKLCLMSHGVVPCFMNSGAFVYLCVIVTHNSSPTAVMHYWLWTKYLCLIWIVNKFCICFAKNQLISKKYWFWSHGTSASLSPVLHNVDVIPPSWWYTPWTPLKESCIYRSPVLYIILQHVTSNEFRILIAFMIIDNVANIT